MLHRKRPIGPGAAAQICNRTLERKVMRATWRLYPVQYARLTEVRGVGEVVATTFLVEIYAFQ